MTINKNIEGLIWQYWQKYFSVHVRETLGLLSTLEWVHELHLGHVDFELDAKRVVESFLSSDHGMTWQGFEVLFKIVKLYLILFMKIQMWGLYMDKQMRLSMS